MYIYRTPNIYIYIYIYKHPSSTLQSCTHINKSHTQTHTRQPSHTQTHTHQPDSETHLLQLMRQAVLAPLPWMFQEVTDRNGNPYYYNAQTDSSQRRHPLDEFFHDRVAELRDNTEAEGDEGRSEWQVCLSVCLP